jgi:hypothetical protein
VLGTKSHVVSMMIFRTLPPLLWTFGVYISHMESKIEADLQYILLIQLFFDLIHRN